MTTTTTAKAMHVSPFLPMDVDYRITWTVPDAELNLRIEVERDHTPVFDAELALRRTTIEPRGAPSPCWRATRCCRSGSRQGSMRKPRASSYGGSRVPSSLPTAGKEEPMIPQRAHPSVSPERLRCNSSSGSPAARFDVVDPFGDARFGDDTATQASHPLDVTVRVHDRGVYSRILHEGSVGLGESYADGWWDTDDLTGFLRLAHRSLARTHSARDRVYRWLRPVVDPIARRRRADKARTPATSGPTTTSGTSSSNGCSTRR